MTTSPQERAAVDQAPADPVREPGLSVLAFLIAAWAIVSLISAAVMLHG